MTMTIERLKALTEAYGADQRRWPQAEREAAQAIVVADPANARGLLFYADQTDAALNASPRPAVSTALRDRVLASALAAGLTPKQAKKVWDRLLVWFMAGWAAAACAGVVAGVNLTGHLTADDQTEAVLSQSMLGTVDDSEVLG
ncbi:hypothetical protein BH10PSE1_BH10PSE1_25230 [soil metagenome]